MQKIQCAICGRNKYSSVLYKKNFTLQKIDENIFSARRMPDKIHYQINRCGKCGLIYSSPILAEERIKNLYQKSTVSYEEEIGYLKETYGRYLKKCFAYLPSNPKLLEIGSGNGFFLEKAKELGIKKIKGIEPGKAAVDKARPEIKKELIMDFFPSKKIKIDSFDIICFFQTLDHIIDPNKFLTETRKALKKNGLVLCIVHDSNGLSVKLLGENSPIFDIEHVYLFNKKTLAEIFELNRFKIVDIFEVKNRFSVGYCVRMLPLPKIIKEKFSSFLKFIRLDKLSVRFSAGNMGIIAQKI